MGERRSRISVNPERDKYLHEETTKFANRIGMEIASKYTLPEGEELIITAPRIGKIRLNWVNADHEEGWEQVLSLDWTEKEKACLTYFYENRSRTQAWWRVGYQDEVLNGNSPPLNLSVMAVFNAVTLESGPINRKLRNIRPRFKITFDGPAAPAVLMKGLI